jgi:hypothetical protein
MNSKEAISLLALVSCASPKNIGSVVFVADAKLLIFNVFSTASTSLTKEGSLFHYLLFLLMRASKIPD